jgi:hypothetical protein
MNRHELRTVKAQNGNRVGMTVSRKNDAVYPLLSASPSPFIIVSGVVRRVNEKTAVVIFFARDSLGK